VAPRDAGSGSDPHDRARSFIAATAGEDAQLAAGLALVPRMCRAAAHALSLSGCAVHLVGRDGVSGVAGSSDARSTRIADIAFTTGDGPELDAFRLRRPVLVADLARDSKRWPGFAHAALAVGVAAVHCFPLQVGGISLGVLDLYADAPRVLSPDELSLALAFSHLAVLTILGDQAIDEDGELEPLLDHRAEIHQAQGMVMVDLGVDLAEALLRMRAHAFQAGEPLINVAREIIAGLVLPSGDPA
jgi:GAF domain-containing protein